MSVDACVAVSGMPCGVDSGPVRRRIAAAPAAIFRWTPGRIDIGVEE